jgi:phosphoenolpyruvate phosphomutase
MIVLILNSGMGRRMGVLTEEHPKCMTEITGVDSILSRQLKIIEKSGIKILL